MIYSDTYIRRWQIYNTCTHMRPPHPAPYIHTKPLTQISEPNIWSSPLSLDGMMVNHECQLARICSHHGSTPLGVSVTMFLEIFNRTGWPSLSVHDTPLWVPQLNTSICLLCFLTVVQEHEAAGRGIHLKVFQLRCLWSHIFILLEVACTFNLKSHAFKLNESFYCLKCPH